MVFDKINNMKKYFIIIIIIAILILGTYFFYNWWSYGKFPKCKEACIAASYSDGNCTDWGNWESPETKCSSLNSNFITGRFSDCSKTNKTPKNVVRAGGVICCCK